jgi:hypothetical protein
MSKLVVVTDRAEMSRLMAEYAEYWREAYRREREERAYQEEQARIEREECTQLLGRSVQRVRQVLCILPAAHSTNPSKKNRKRRNIMLDINKVNKDVKTVGAMRTEAEEKGLEQLERFDDPRLVDLVNLMHVYASDKDWCAEFDRMAAGLGIPPRPKKDYGTITRTGVFEFNGQNFDVTATIDVFGEVEGTDAEGKAIVNEASAIAEFKTRYGKEFDEAVREKWSEQALKQMVSTFTFAAKEDAKKKA